MRRCLVHRDATDDAKWTNHSREQLAQEAFKFDPNDRLHRAVMMEPWARILDFGCGTGLWVNYWRGAKQYVGIDRNPDMIAGARSRWQDDVFPTFIQCDVLGGERLPFPDGWFDVAVTVAVLQHNHDSEKEIALSEIRRVLRNQGRFCGYEDTYGPFNPTPGHRTEMEDGYSHSHAGWREVFEPHGFTCVFQERDLHVFQAV